LDLGVSVKSIKDYYFYQCNISLADTKLDNIRYNRTTGLF